MTENDETFLARVADLDLGAQVLAFAIVSALKLGKDDYALRMGNYGWKLGISKEDRRKVMAVTNDCFLAQRELEWTSHGFKRSFRFWSVEEKADYLAFANEVVGAIRGNLTDKVCLGYGTALAFARCGDLIPHDDDIDLIIAMPQRQYGSITGAIPAVELCLQEAGFSTAGSYMSHRHVRNPKGRALDIFVGMEEDGYFSSYPGPRRDIRIEEVFPFETQELFGHRCCVPRDLNGYLSKVYGPTWREPDPNFSHKWDRAPFSDLLLGK